MAKALEGKSAIVTGGAGGLGLTIVKSLLHHGAKVLLVDLSIKDLISDPALTPFSQAGTLKFSLADVTLEEDAARYASEAVEAFGRLDIAILSAGICPPPGSWMEADVASLDQAMAVNTKGVYFGVKYIAQAMRPFALEAKATGGCSITFISSTGGLRGTPGMSPYAASKWAVRGLGLTAAQEFAPWFIRCNTIFPSGLETSMFASLPESHKETLVAQSPMGRLGTPQEVANAVVFLSSNEASYVSGSSWPVHGGLFST